MLNYDSTNQEASLLSLSDIPGVKELDDRAAESISGGYQVVFYSGANGTGEIVQKQNLRSIRGLDGGSGNRFAAGSFRVVGAPGSQYKLTTQTGTVPGFEQQYTGFTTRPVNLNKGGDQRRGILGYSVNRIK
jgi:hypothetical protein